MDVSAGQPRGAKRRLSQGGPTHAAADEERALPPPQRLVAAAARRAAEAEESFAKAEKARVLEEARARQAAENLAQARRQVEALRRAVGEDVQPEPSKRRRRASGAHTADGATRPVSRTTGRDMPDIDGVAATASGQPLQRGSLDARRAAPKSEGVQRPDGRRKSLISAARCDQERLVLSGVARAAVQEVTSRRAPLRDDAASGALARAAIDALKVARYRRFRKTPPTWVPMSVLARLARVRSLLLSRRRASGAGAAAGAAGPAATAGVSSQPSAQASVLFGAGRRQSVSHRSDAPSARGRRLSRG
eukprot:SRR837773.5701.p1 GENE.SRR837773.5701~~SRR837773.5701.p1  ORF type:complete len:323 (+),score=35.37 SRR837773.5701:54-971(+)